MLTSSSPRPVSVQSMLRKASIFSKWLLHSLHPTLGGNSWDSLRLLTDAPAVRECHHLSDVYYCKLTKIPGCRQAAHLCLASFFRSQHCPVELEAWRPTCLVSQFKFKTRTNGVSTSDCMQNLCTHLIPSSECSPGLRKLSSCFLSLILFTLAIAITWVFCDYFDTVCPLK